MPSTNRRSHVGIFIVGLALTVALAGGLVPSGASGPNDDRAVVHVLNRIGFGPRGGDSGDVARVKAMGLQRYIDEQLHPERIPDTAMTSRLSGLTTLGMSSRAIAETYEIPQLQARREKKQDAADAQPKMADPVQQKANRVIVELGEQKILRAVYSERQLQEVLTDFWFNHFNVDARKGPSRFLLTEYERDVIRPHVLGKFRDLLEADAKSPAMLFYLDNWMSADPNSAHMTMAAPRLGRGAGRGMFGGRLVMPPAPRPNAQGKKTPKGLN